MLELQPHDWIMANYWHQPGIIKQITEHPNGFSIIYVSLPEYLYYKKKLFPSLDHPQNNYLNRYQKEETRWVNHRLNDYIWKVPPPPEVVDAPDNKGRFLLNF